MSGCWVVQTRPGFEVEYAEQTGAFVPKVERRWKHRGKQHERLVGELPGYAFVEADVRNDPYAYHEAAASEHFIGVLPGKVTQAEYDRLREGLDDRGVRKPKQQDKAVYFKPGDLLEVVNGPFTGAQVVCKYHRGEKICVSYLQAGTALLHMHSTWCVKSSTDQPLPPQHGGRRKRRSR